MTEPQTWAMLSAFIAMMFGALTVVSTLFVRILRSEVGGLRVEMVSEFRAVRTETASEIGLLRAEMRAEFRAVRMEFASDIGTLRTELKTEIGELRTELKTEIGTLNTRIDDLDRDVQALVAHTFGHPRE